jgi:hypothetical protein
MFLNVQVTHYKSGGEVQKNSHHKLGYKWFNIMI